MGSARDQSKKTVIFDSRENMDHILRELQNDDGFDISFKWKCRRIALPSLYISPVGSKFGRFIPKYKYEYEIRRN